jgi:long-chain fatty acid transport protein
LNERGVSVMPAVAFVNGNSDSKHTHGFSAPGISGFGVTFPEDTNYPQDGLGNPKADDNLRLGSSRIMFSGGQKDCRIQSD